MSRMHSFCVHCCEWNKNAYNRNCTHLNPIYNSLESPVLCCPLLMKFQHEQVIMGGDCLEKSKYFLFQEKKYYFLKGIDPIIAPNFSQKMHKICWKSILRYGGNLSQNITWLGVLEPLNGEPKGGGADLRDRPWFSPFFGKNDYFVFVFLCCKVSSGMWKFLENIIENFIEKDQVHKKNKI